jgi:Ion channel
MVVMLVGIGATLSALLIQGLASALGAETIVGLLMRRVVGVRVWSNALAMLGLILILLAGHLAQTAVWAIAFMAAGEFAEFAVAFYHSAVNYTTLGYGDMVMSPRWRLLGPLEAASGMLAFGWSTAVIVTVAIRLARVRHRALYRSSASPRSTTRGRFS